MGQAQLRKEEIKQLKSQGKKSKGIYIQTSRSKALAALVTGNLEIGVGDAGLKRSDQGDIDSRQRGLTSSKYHIGHHIVIGTIENPIGFNRDYDLYDLLTVIAPQITVNGKDTELFRMPIPPDMLERFKQQLGDKEWDDDAFEEIKVFVKDTVRGVASTFDPDNLADLYSLRDVQKLVKEIILDLKEKGVPLNVAAELAPRIGKTILFLDLMLTLWKQGELSQAIVMAYGVGLSVFRSYEDTINKFRDFKQNIEFIDVDNVNAEKLHKQATKQVKLPLLMTSLNASSWKEKYKWIHNLTTPTFGLLEEGDFGGHCDRQVKIINYLLAYKKDCLRVNTSGTNMGKIAKAMGGDNIDEVITVPYCLVEQDSSISDVVKRKFYNMIFQEKMKKLLEDYDATEQPNITKILKKAFSQHKFISALFRDMLDYETLYGLSLSQQAGGLLKHIMLFVNLTKKEMDDLAKIIEQYCEEHKVLVLHGDFTNNRRAEILTKKTLKECEIGVHGKRTNLIVISNMMGSRSYTVGQIQACVFMSDGGEVYPFMQKYSRCLSPLKGKLFGHIFDFSFDPNKTRNTVMAIGVESAQLSKLKKISLPKAIRQVCNSVSIKDHLSGTWMSADEILKMFEDIDRLLEVANAKPIDLDDLSAEEFDILANIKIGKKDNKKIKPTVPKGKTYVNIGSGPNKGKSDEVIAQIKKAIQSINNGASTIYWLANDSGRPVIGFLKCLDKISKNKKTAEDFTTLFGASPVDVKKISQRLQLSVLDLIIENTHTGKSEKYSTNKDLGIIGINEYECWKHYFIKHLGKTVGKNITILVACGGYGNEIQALIDLYGKSILKQITFNDEISCFTNRVKRLYNISIIEGNFTAIMKKFDYVIMNSPYKQGLWRKFIKHGLSIANKKVLAIAPDANVKTSKKYNESKKLYEDGGIQDIENCHHFFPDVVTSSPISFNYFNKEQPFNAQVFNRPPTPEEMVFYKIQALGKKLGTLKQISVGLKNKHSSGKIEQLSSITKNGPVLETIEKSDTKIINNPRDYFYVNQFFGSNANDPIYNIDKDKMGIGPNVFVIDHSKKYTLDQFKAIYTHKAMRFILLYIRGVNQRTFGYSFSELPLIDPKTIDVYSALGLNKDDQKIIESIVK